MENTFMMTLDYVGDGEAMEYAQLGQQPLVRTTATSLEPDEGLSRALETYTTSCCFRLVVRRLEGEPELQRRASLGFGQGMMLCCSSAAECSPLCLLRPMPSLARCRVGVSLNFDSVFVRRCHGNVDSTNAWRFSG
jgi:hypothetical protein